jgi:hypothetical protein
MGVRRRHIGGFSQMSDTWVSGDGHGCQERTIGVVSQIRDMGGCVWRGSGESSGCRMSSLGARRGLVCL